MAAPAAAAARGAAGRAGARSSGRAVPRGSQRSPSSGAATKTEQARLKAQARKGDDMLEEIFKQGVEEGRRERGARPAPKKRARRRPPASVRSAARELRRPVTAQVGGGLRLIGLSLAVVGLYVALENAPAAAGVIGAAQRALAWLASPARSIPYGGSS